MELFTLQIYFEAFRGTSYKGDIALDDIVVYQGPCPAPMMCDFEDQALCGFIQATDDQFDWSVHQGSTSSVNTGPVNDHTYGTSAGKVKGRIVAI